MNYQDFQKAVKWYETNATNSLKRRYECIYFEYLPRVQHGWRQPTIELAEDIIDFLIQFGCPFIPKTNGLQEAIVHAIQESSSFIAALQQFTIEDDDLDTPTQVESKSLPLGVISELVFNQFCGVGKRFSDVATAKTLHLLCPQFFVMWDTKTRQALTQGSSGSDAQAYVRSYLPRVQQDIRKLISEVVGAFGCARPQAVEKLRSTPKNRKSLAKLANEYYWVCLSSRAKRGICT